MTVNMILRTSTKYLYSWLKSQDRKPLIVRGARQVGKSTLVRQFAKIHNLKLHEVNLEEHKLNLLSVFKSLNTELILKEIILICNQGKLEERSLIFIDEIQSIPEAITALRYFYEKNPEVPIIAAGSLLDFVLDREQISIPVGRASYYYLGVVTFEEFLVANKKNELIEYINSYNLQNPFSTFIHNQLIEQLKDYLLIGGMPEVVQSYITNSLSDDYDRIKKELLISYEDDFRKYKTRIDFDKLNDVLAKVFSFIGQKIKYVNFLSNDKAVTTKNILGLLEKAQLISFCNNTNATSLPLSGCANGKSQKLYFLDCGILASKMGLHAKSFRIANQDNNAIGILSEQYVAQHLIQKEHYTKTNLWYWLREDRANNAEVDFIEQIESKIIPIEVKSGSTGTLKSLNQFLLSNNNIKLALRFNLDLPSSINYIESQKRNVTLISLPLYLIQQRERLLNLKNTGEL